MSQVDDPAVGRYVGNIVFKAVGWVGVAAELEAATDAVFDNNGFAVELPVLIRARRSGDISPG